MIVALSPIEIDGSPWYLVLKAESKLMLNEALIFGKKHFYTSNCPRRCNETPIGIF
jgi:hypothetical protein